MQVSLRRISVFFLFPILKYFSLREGGKLGLRRLGNTPPDSYLFSGLRDLSDGLRTSDHRRTNTRIFILSSGPRRMLDTVGHFLDPMVEIARIGSTWFTLNTNGTHIETQCVILYGALNILRLPGLLFDSEDLSAMLIFVCSRF